MLFFYKLLFAMNPKLFQKRRLQINIPRKMWTLIKRKKYPKQYRSPSFQAKEPLYIILTDNI